MKILAINVFYAPIIGGGAEITMKNLYEGLRDLGHKINILTFSDKFNYTENINGVNVYRVKITNLYFPLFVGNQKPNALTRKLWHLIDIYNPISKDIVEKHINNIKPDVVVVHNTQGWSTSIYSAMVKQNIPFIQVLHDQYLLCHTNMFKNNKNCKKQCLLCKMMTLPNKIQSNKATAVVGVSKFILNRLLSYEYFKQVPIKKVIHNSRKIEVINNKIHGAKKYDGIIYFGFIGTLASNKGIELLLQSYLKADIKNSMLLIAGDGNTSYVSYLRKSYVDNRISYLGKVNPQDFFTKVDVTVVPSIWEEALGMVVMESFYFGVPVIGSRIGGIPEMIEEGVNGVLFEPGNQLELKNCLVEFMNTIYYWKDRQKEIQQSAANNLDYNSWIKQWDELLDNVIAIQENH